MVPNTPYTTNSLFFPSEENLRHKDLSIKVPVEEEPNQPPLTLLCVSDHLLSFVIVVDERAVMKAYPGIPNTLNS